MDRTTTSLANGTYRFEGLRPGIYSVAEAQPASYLDGRDTLGNSGGIRRNDHFSDVSLAVGQQADGYLFGEKTPPDLVVTKSDGVTAAKPGELLTYTITVVNSAAQKAERVTVTDDFPATLELLSISDGGRYDARTGVITWNVGSIAGNHAQTITLTVVARVPASVAQGLASVTNSVSAFDLHRVDATPANNIAHDTDRLSAAPDLYVFKTDNLATAKVGQETTYTIRGGNAGELTSQRVIVTDTLPPGLRFVAASGGGQLVDGRVVWKLGDLAPGQSFQLTVRVVVEAAAGSQTVINTVSIADRFGVFHDATPANNQSADATKIEPFEAFAFDSFHHPFGEIGRSGLLPLLSPIDIYRDASLPLAPIYSGEADPGATLVVSLYNSKGEQIGSQTVLVDAGGNWLTTFASATMRDIPSSVRIALQPAPYSYGEAFGHNLRTYFSPALNPGHFFETIRGLGLDRRTAPLLSGLGLENPLQLGTVKYGGELLSTQATATGE